MNQHNPTNRVATKAWPIRERLSVILRGSIKPLLVAVFSTAISYATANPVQTVDFVTIQVPVDF